MFGLIDPIVVAFTEEELVEAKKGTSITFKKIEPKKDKEDKKDDTKKPTDKKQEAKKDDKKPVDKKEDPGEELDSVMQFMLDANCTKNQAIAYFKMILKVTDGANYLSPAGQAKKVGGAFVLSRNLFTDEGWAAMKSRYKKVRSAFIKEMDKVRAEEPQDDDSDDKPKKKTKKAPKKKKPEDSIFNTKAEEKAAKKAEEA